jgi:protocatechuate 3,4-dioxygenase beta subunit
MRPLVVLFLVLGALAALIFALASLAGTGRRGDGSRGLPVAPREGPVQGAPVELAPPPLEAESAAEETDEGRQAVAAGNESGGPKVSFGAIEGHVLDQAGLPIAGAKVFLRNERPSPFGEDLHDFGGSDAKPFASAESDAEGVFRFARLDPRKDWALTVTHERFQMWVSEMAIPVPDGGVWPETVILRPGMDCSGFVRDGGTKAPIAGALLVAESPLARIGKKKSRGRLETRTDANGAFVFRNVASSQSAPPILTITAAGYATQVHNNFSLVAVEPQVHIKNKQTGGRAVGRTVDFELEPAKVIAGRVLGPDRRGVPGVEIEALNQTGTVGCEGHAKSGRNGEFLIESLATGAYIVRVKATHLDARPMQRVEAGTTDVVIELFELAVATGRVVDEEDKPITSFTVKARIPNDYDNAYGVVAAQRSVKHSSDGSFEINGLPEGSYVIEGSAEGYASCFSEVFTATQGMVASDILVRLNRGGSLAGRIIDSYTGAPVPGVEVTTVENDYMEEDLVDLFADMDPSALTKALVHTDAGGAFRVEVMTPGTYQIQARYRGYSPVVIQDVVIVAGQETEVPPLSLIRGAVIRGVVYGRDREILPGANIQLYPVDVDDSFGHRMTRADGTGRYQIENMPPGTYQLSASRPSAGSGGNPFEALGDIKLSQVEISIEDGKVYDLDLRMGSN